MMKKSVLIFLLAVLLIISGCAGQPDGKDKSPVTSPGATDTPAETATPSPETGDEDTAAPSLGGISLGDSIDKVTDVLGDDYEETEESDSAGIMGEDVSVLTYESGIVVTVGKTSKKVLRISTTSEDFKTDEGIKVGDTAKAVSEAYASGYEKAVSRQTEEVLEGWYLIGDGEEAVIIFDFDKTDDTMVNENVTPDTKVEEITLAYWKHFD